MINNDKVKDMTWLAVFEKNEGPKVFKTTKYFKRDYVGLHLIKGFVAGTITFILCLALWGVMNMEPLMETIHVMDIPAFVSHLLLVYAGFMGVYLAIIMVYAQVTYYRSRKRLKAYSRRLRKILDEH